MRRGWRAVACAVSLLIALWPCSTVSAVAGAPPGSGDTRPRWLLADIVLRGEEGPQGAVPEASVAGRSSASRAEEKAVKAVKAVRAVRAVNDERRSR